jgi:hypothetical protein
MAIHHSQQHFDQVIYIAKGSRLRAIAKGNCRVRACCKRSEIHIALFASPLASVVVWVLPTKRKKPFARIEIYPNKAVTSSRPV